MIDLRRLHVLRAVDHYGTVTAAAEALHFTPSAASQQIRQLGKDLGVTLLEPHGRRVRLTCAAQTLLAHADAIAARWEQAEIDLRAEREQPAGLLRVSAFPTALSSLLAPMTAALTARHPDLTVRLVECEALRSFDLLFDGTVDLAVVETTPQNPPVADDGFDQQPLLDDPFDLVVPTGHRFAGRTDFTLAEAAEEPWILASPELTCRAQTIAACTAAGFTPVEAHRAHEWNATVTLIANGLGVAVVPRMFCLPPHLPVVRVPCADHPRRKLLTATRRGARENPAVAAALAELATLAPRVLAGNPVPPATGSAPRHRTSAAR